jgi:hypothetical protein
MRQNRLVEQVPEPQLEVAVQSVLKHPLGFLPSDVQVPFQDYSVLRQGAGLVRAQSVHRTEILDRVKALDDHPLVRHCTRALGEIHRHDHRQHFGREANRCQLGSALSRSIVAHGSVNLI